MRNLLLVVLLSASVAAVPSGVPDDPNIGDSERRAMLILDRIESVDDCDYTCHFECPYIGEHGLYWGGSAFTDNGGGSHHCIEFEFECSAHLCGGGGTTEEEQDADVHPEDLAELEALLETASPAAVRSMMAESARLEYNHDRDALQVIGCDEQVILSVPMNGRLTASTAQ